MQLQPYLIFNGRCEEAIRFYESAVGAKVELLMRHKDSPQPPPAGVVPPGFDNKVLHATLRVGESVVLASDGCSDGKTDFQGFSLSVSLPNAADVDRVFTRLADGGEVKMPLSKTFWSPRFGMLVDRFGVGWMVGIPA